MPDETRHYPKNERRTACSISLVRTPFSMPVKLARGTRDVDCVECMDAMGWGKKPKDTRDYAVLFTSRRQVQRPVR